MQQQHQRYQHPRDPVLWPFSAQCTLCHALLICIRNACCFASVCPCCCQVTFTIPSALRKQALLYSGLIELQSDDPAVPSLVVPYQGFSQPMSNLRVPARVEPDQDIILSATLDKLHNSICYAPSSKPKFINAILDAQVRGLRLFVQHPKALVMTASIQHCSQ